MKSGNSTQCQGRKAGACLAGAKQGKDVNEAGRGSNGEGDRIKVSNVAGA